MSSEQSNILRRQEQLNLWYESETDKAPNFIKEAEKIKFPKEVQFFSACNSNDWPEIERLLNAGIDINCTQDDGLTALHQACIDDDENLVRYLVTHGATIDVQDKEGWTPLFAAISCNYLPITNYLLSSGARLDVVSFDGELPLDQANNEAMTSFLIDELAKRNLDPDVIRNRERIIMLNEVERMKRNKDFSNFTMVDNGATMLHVAASKDYIDVLENLLEIITPDLLNRKDNDGWNALHVAAHWNNRRICVLLVEADIDFDCITSSKQTVLEVADDDVKPYLREEIRKARFRRDEKASVKRPAPSPNGEYQPSETKIICQEKPPKTPTDKQLNGDKHVTVVEEDPGTTPIIIENQEPRSRNSLGEVISDPINNVVDINTDHVKLNSNETTHTMDISPSDSQANNKPIVPSTFPVINDNSKSTVEKSDSLNTDKNESKSKAAIILPPVKSVESESQRKDKARHVRSSRRSTQGVTAEDIGEAKKCMSNVQRQEKFNIPSQISTIMESKSDVTENLPVQNHTEPQITNKTESGNVSHTENASHPKLTTHQNPLKTLPLNPTSDPSSESSDTTEKQRGSYLVNKRRTRERPPTGTIDLKDIYAAQLGVINAESRDKKNEDISLSKEADLNTEKSDLSKKSEIDYKALYENECREKEKLHRNLSRVRKELQESEDKLKHLQNNSTPSKNNKITQKPPLYPSDSDPKPKEYEKLKEDNRKLKEANSALIRVISRLSHPSAVSKSVAGSI